MRTKRKRKIADATVRFGIKKNLQGRLQCCVWAECHLSGNRAGPIWGHSDESVRKVLAELTSECDCPASFHRGTEYSGHRV